MVNIDKDKNLQEWIQQNTFTNAPILFNFLRELLGDFAIIPIADELATKTFIDGSMMKKYDFALVAMLKLSENTDDTNTDNMAIMRQWQDWIDEQEELGNYPDFGKKASCYELENLNNMPSLAMEFDNGMAKYMLMATIKYLEEK